jgi:4a-hydroxytetrahydrobiopterin dehydratase
VRLRFSMPPKISKKFSMFEPLVLALQNVFRVLLVVTVMADLMKAPELKERLKKIPEWELEKKHIERTFEFDDFADAIDFVNAVAEVAEEEEHHPDIDIRYNKVRLLLSTHSKGGLTELDFALAERIDTLSE